MIYDILETFEKQYKEKGDKLILDNYILKDGLYVKINKNEELEYYIYKNNKNEKVKEYCFKDLSGNIKSSLYEWFKERDYYSSYLNSNKAFGDKKIHNVNYLSLFIKLESFTSNDKNKLISDDAIELQYKNLKTYEKFHKKEEKEILKSVKDEIDNIERLNDVDNKYSIIKEKLDSIIEMAKDYNITNYIKVFFDEYIGKYKKESSFYYAIKIFNDIKYSEMINSKVWGASDSNFGLNSKKPFFESKTKWSSSPPFMITKENALKLKRFFDWLNVQDYKDNFPLAKEFFFHKHSQNGKAVIDDFDYIPSKIDVNNNKLKKSIYFKNHLIIRDGKRVIEDKTIDLLWELEKQVHEVFYNSQLINNYFGEVYKKLDASFRSLIYLTRESMVNYFKKYDERSFYGIVKKYGSKFILEHIRKNRMLQASLSLNLKLSLLTHKGEIVMNIKSMQENIIKKLEKSNYDNLSSEEFCYLTGQVAMYLVGRSKKKDKKGDMLDPFLKIKRIDKLKNEIRFFYSKYNHEIALGNKKINNALSLIMAYENESQINLDCFLVGVLSNNIFYMKKED